MIDYLSQIEILLLKKLKLFKIPGFPSFFLISQIPGFGVFWQPCPVVTNTYHKVAEEKVSNILCQKNNYIEFTIE